jgi:cytochrome c oxidase subunit 3
MSRTAESLEPFVDRETRARADTLGMFVFLASEVMLFGGLFGAIGLYRIAHPLAAAKAAEHLKIWLGSANTAVLLTASFLVALAVGAAKEGKNRAVGWLMLAAAGLGLVFLAIKGTEYRLEYLDGLMPGIGPPSPLGEAPPTLFISLYFVSTFLHAIHVTIGAALLAWSGVGALRRRLALPDKAKTVELVGLYWHLVDVIWVFLFPLLYLARP